MAQLMRFRRLMQNPKRASEEMRKAYSTGGCARQSLFNEWVGAGEDLDELSLRMTRSRSVSQDLENVCGFKNRLQLLEMYGNDATYVDAMIANHVSSGKPTRDDPNFPGNEKFRQYWVVTDTSAKNNDVIRDTTELIASGAPTDAHFGQLGSLFATSDITRNSPMMLLGAQP